MSRQLIIETAAAENGTKESPFNSNKTKYGEWYGLDGVKWCAISLPSIPEKKFTSGAFLKKGDSGSAVVSIQHALNQSGAKPQLDEDGVFGNDTVTAVKVFQQKKKLQVDGIVGPATFQALAITDV